MHGPHIASGIDDYDSDDPLDVDFPVATSTLGSNAAAYSRIRSAGGPSSVSC